MNERDLSQAETLIVLFETHAERVVERSDTSMMYAMELSRKVQVLREHIADGTEASVQGIVSTWWEEFKPIGEAVFGTVLSEQPREWIDEYGEYTPTTTEFMLGRIRGVSLDGQSGPMIALDLLVVGQ